MTCENYIMNNGIKFQMEDVRLHTTILQNLSILYKPKSNDEVIVLLNKNLQNTKILEKKQFLKGKKCFYSGVFTNITFSENVCLHLFKL